MAVSNLTNNATYAMQFFQAKGWTKEQAAGIVGNLQTESGVNLSVGAVGDFGQAYGIAQWHPDRQAQFQKVYGKPIQQATLNEQLEFVNWELNNTEKSAGDKIRATNTATDAASAADQYYERSSGAARGKRIGYANSLLDLPPGQAQPDPNATTQQQNQNIQNQQQAGSTAPTNPDRPYVEPVIDPATGQPNNVDSNSSGINQYSAEPDIIDFTQPLMNVLHNYASYTYGISLHVMTADEYNGLVNGTLTNYAPARVLVASAGRWNNDNVSTASGGNPFQRSPFFAEDFYFDNLGMTTVIGTNAHSRNTNAIEFNFGLIEPYGMTLVNRLLDVANDADVACPNYLDMIYLLQIDFFGVNDAGETVGAIPGITKRFPVKIIQMNITAHTGGSKYEILAVPYNHSAFEQTTVSTPANFELNAGTVGEFFQSGTATNPKSQVTSFTSALNGWNTDLAKNNKIGVPDSYAFNIDPKIAQSGFTNASTTSPRDTAMANPTNSGSIRQGNLGTPTTDYNPNTKNFSINAGTSIDRVVDYVVRNSDYIQKQITIPDGMDPQTYLQQKQQNSNQPLNWYKITPTVNVGAFDPVRKVYSKNITYNVNPYVIYNVKSDVAPQGRVKDFVKEYNYIYTGKNVDVLEFELNFNTLYYTAQTAYRGAVEKLYKTPSDAAAADPTKNTDTYQANPQDPNNVMPLVMKPQVYNAKARATGGSVTPKAVAVADLEDSLMTLSAADMLNVNLKILGDPQFLKQDDCFLSPMLAGKGSPDPRLTSNGSLLTDYGEIYVRLTFRTPTDIDEVTGLMKFGKYQTSLFSGIYRVLTVTSEFSKGEFTQTLNLIRLPNQQIYDYNTAQIATVNQRATDITPNILKSFSTKTPQIVPSLLTSAPLESLDQQIAMGPAPIPPILDSTQQNLRNVYTNAGTQPITADTAPASIAPFRTLV